MHHFWTFSVLCVSQIRPATQDIIMRIRTIICRMDAPTSCRSRKDLTNLFTSALVMSKIISIVPELIDGAKGAFPTVGGDANLTVTVVADEETSENLMFCTVAEGACSVS